MTKRPASTLAKLERMRKALRHEEPDRVPVSDFFWGGFVQRRRRELHLPPDADPYRYYDLDCCQAALEAAAGWLDGFVIWGDVAYRKGLFFAPAYWREHFKPWVKAMVDLCHAHGLPVIYHGCGNVNAIIEDYIEIGVDACNPLEVKAGMDAVELRHRYGHRIGLCGNLDVQNWERGNRREIRAEILRKLHAAEGGGLILQSDHSVTSAVSGRTYDDIVNLIRQRGVYPLQ